MNIEFMYSEDDYRRIEAGADVARPQMQVPEYPAGSWGAFLAAQARGFTKSTFARLHSEGFVVDHTRAENGTYNRAFGYKCAVTPDMFGEPEDRNVTERTPTGGAGWVIKFMPA
jgi:hypothetical protein